MLSYLINMLIFIAQMSLYLIAILAVSYCMVHVFRSLHYIDDSNLSFNHVGGSSNVDFGKVNKSIDDLRKKLEEQNAKYEAAIAEVQIAEVSTKIREKKLEIAAHCAKITEKLVDYLQSEK